jgi:hypothetical protein
MTIGSRRVRAEFLAFPTRVVSHSRFLRTTAILIRRRNRTQAKSDADYAKWQADQAAAKQQEEAEKQQRIAAWNAYQQSILTLVTIVAFGIGARAQQPPVPPRNPNDHVAMKAFMAQEAALHNLKREVPQQPDKRRSV